MERFRLYIGIHLVTRIILFVFDHKSCQIVGSKFPVWFNEIFSAGFFSMQLAFASKSSLHCCTSIVGGRTTEIKRLKHSWNTNVSVMECMVGEECIQSRTIVCGIQSISKHFTPRCHRDEHQLERLVPTPNPPCLTSTLMTDANLCSTPGTPKLFTEMKYIRNFKQIY